MPVDGTRALGGTIAATVTPLREDGAALDEDAVEPVVAFLARGGVDGILALGTTGEGIMLSPDERRRAAELFIAAAGDGLRVAVHCGAQTTAATADLAAHAAEHGADAVAVIAPPYYRFDDAELLGHFRSAAAACAPLPFYVYEFADRSGYAVPTSVLAELRDTTENLTGLKVSDAPMERFEPYLLEGLDVLVGPESLIAEGLGRGAVGAVSGLAAAVPEIVVEAVRSGDPAAAGRAGSVRAALQRLPVPGVFKVALGLRGIPVREDVRAPLRILTPDERDAVRGALERAGVAG